MGKQLTKTYYYQEENGYGGDFIYDHAEGDKIEWKAGKDLTVKVESKKQRNKDTKEKLIPRAIDWFTGEALQFEQGFDDFDEDEFEDEDDEDDEDEDERDEDEDEEDED